jgi:chromosome partitioning protein
VAGITESCSVCQGEFEVQFRYQMEERDGGFSFFCTQKCLEKSQLAGSGATSGTATCDACAKRFSPDLVSQVLYVEGRRHYACSLPCRAQILSEAKGVRLGDIASSSSGPGAPAARREGAEGQPRLPRDPAAHRDNSLPPVLTVPPAKPTTRKTALEGAVAVPIAPPPPRRAATAPAAPKPTTGLPRIIAVFNHKGGTGKTTTAVSIAAGLAAKGKKVLLVDTDAQGNVSVSLGAGSERSLYHVLVMGLRVADAVKEVRPNLDLLPANETLAAAELYLAGRQNRDRVLHDRLAAATAAYDFVVLDCSPSLSLMNQNALVFADSVLVPVACDYLSLVGVRQVIKTVKNVNALLHHPVQIWGVLPTFYDSRANICREAVTTLKQHFGDRCLAPVRAVMKIKEAPAQGKTIFEYAEDSNAAEDYAAVVQQILVSNAAGSQPTAAPREHESRVERQDAASVRPAAEAAASVAAASA